MGGTASKTKQDFGVHNFFGVDLHGASIGVAFLIILAIAIIGMLCCHVNNACKQWIFGRSAPHRHGHHPRAAPASSWPPQWPPQPWHAPPVPWPMYSMMTMNPPTIHPTATAAIQEIPNEASPNEASSRRPGSTNV